MGSWTPADPRKTPASQQGDQLQRAQANVVQHHYVRAQVHDINMRQGNALIAETIQALREVRPEFQKWKDSKVEDLFDKMTAHLQLADLTINFEARSWFMRPNDYDSYTQMYERAVREIQPGVKEMRLKDTPVNEARGRAAVDDRVTFRTDMATFSAGNRKGPTFEDEFEGIGRVMSPGGLKENLKVRTGEYLAKNPFFNPKSKQVFAALNYGYRPHGSTTQYGWSYLVLNPKFKTNALYFAGDTFLCGQLGTKISGNHQVSYRFLGGIFGKAHMNMRNPLFNSCILGQKLRDTNDGYELLEAHLFEPLTFAGNLQAIFISAKEGGRAMTASVLQTVQSNARAFANRHGAKLYFIP